MSVGNLSILGEFSAKIFICRCMDEGSVDCLVLCHNKQNRNVSAKLLTMRATALYKDFNGYRELLLSHYYSNAF